MTQETTADQDAVTLAGLRRLVLHARDGLRATQVQPNWTYSGNAWTPQQIQAYAARLIATDVLTLVADCLPQDGVTLDEHETLRREMDRRLKDAEAQFTEAKNGLGQKLEEAEENAQGWQDDYAELAAVLRQALDMDESDGDDFTIDEYRQFLADIKAAREIDAAEAASAARKGGS